MALINIDTEKLAQALAKQVARTLPGILETFTRDLESAIAGLLRNRTITIQIQLGDSTK